MINVAHPSVKDHCQLESALNPILPPEYIEPTHKNAVDLHNFGTSLSRRTKALKVWFLLRLYGIANMQAYVRRVSGLLGNDRDNPGKSTQVASLAQRVKGYIEKEPRLEVVGDTNVSLVCFRVKVGLGVMAPSTPLNDSYLQKDTEELMNKATLE